MKAAIHICLIHAPNHVHADALLDPALYFHHQFSRLGASVSFERNQLRADAVNFVFGAHNGFDPANLQKFSCIIVNLEQVGKGGASLSSAYLRLLRTAVVVDYDPTNPPAYTSRPEDVPVVSFAYAPYLSPSAEQAVPLEQRPIDILFIGSVNQRRMAWLTRMEDAGRQVALLQTPVYGRARDSILRQAKVLVNVHYYESARFEQVRAFVSLSNGTPVISERHAASDPGPVYDACVTWMDEALMDDFFRHDFGTPLFYEVMRHQLELFRQVDNLDEYADLLAFAKGVWQAHEPMLPRVREDAFIGLMYPRQLLPGQVPLIEQSLPVQLPEKRRAPRFQRLEDIEEKVQHLLESENPDQAMIAMANAISSHYHQPGIINHALYYPVFDVYVEQLADRLKQARQSALSDASKPSEEGSETSGDRAGTLIVATELYQVGGHSRLLELLVKSVQYPKVVLTDLFGTYQNKPSEADWIRQRLGKVPLVILNEGNLWQKAMKLADIVDADQPEHIWYVQHQQDVVALVGTLPDMNSRKILLHHADHNPSLGCTLEQVVMVDVTEQAQQTSINSLGRHSHRLPLYVADRGPRAPSATLPLEKMSVVSAGRQGKFLFSGPLAWPLVVAAALRTVGGNFFHIGELNDANINAVRQHLKQQGINPARFRSLGQVASVWETLKTLDAQVYIGSAPFSGGTSAVEAQGCGYPVLPYTGFEEGSLLSDFSSYADVGLGWHDVEELAEQLKKVAEELPERREEARAFYEQHFSKSVFEAAIQEICHG